MIYRVYPCDPTDISGILSIGYSDEANVTHFGPGQRNQYIVHYVLRGKGYFNGQEVGAGQGFLIHPDMREHYFADKETPWSFLWVIFQNTDIAKDWFSTFPADPDTHVFSCHNLSVLRYAVAWLSETGSRTSAELLELFFHIFNAQKRRTDRAENAADSYFHHAVHYIQSHLFRPLTVNEITRFLGVSQPYLYQIFVARCGMSPKRYITDGKIKEAERLLSSTALPIGEVAYALGYEDPLAFSKFFKQQTGCSPRHFRSRET